MLFMCCLGSCSLSFPAFPTTGYLSWKGPHYDKLAQLPRYFRGALAIYIVTCQVHPFLVKWVQCTVRSSFFLGNITVKGSLAACLVAAWSPSGLLETPTRWRVTTWHAMNPMNPHKPNSPSHSKNKQPTPPYIFTGPMSDKRDSAYINTCPLFCFWDGNQFQEIQYCGSPPGGKDG